MSIPRRAALLLLAACTCCLLLASPGLADYSRWCDYSQCFGWSSVPGGNNVQVCDDVYDGTKMAAKFNTASGQHWVIAHGGVHTCNTSDSYRSIYWHQTCQGYKSPDCRDRSYH